MSGIALKSPDLGEGYYQSKLDSVWKRNGYLGAMVIALPALTPASQPIYPAQISPHRMQNLKHS